MKRAGFAAIAFFFGTFAAAAQYNPLFGYLALATGLKIFFATALARSTDRQSQPYRYYPLNKPLMTDAVTDLDDDTKSNDQNSESGNPDNPNDAGDKHTTARDPDDRPTDAPDSVGYHALVLSNSIQEIANILMLHNVPDHAKVQVILSGGVCNIRINHDATPGDHCAVYIDDDELSDDINSERENTRKLQLREYLTSLDESANHRRR